VTLALIGAAIGSGSAGEARATPAAAPERCPHDRQGVAFYRARYAEHRAVREIETEYPAGRKPRNCADADYLAGLWPERALAARLATEAWLLDQRTLDEQTSWQAAIDEVQAAWPDTDDWLRSCSSTEGAGASGEAPWVPNREGSGAGGWLQFMESTFWRMFTAGKADAEARGYIVPREAASWYSRIGQAIAGAWGVSNGRRVEWSGSGC
jgi:hypothetical protein